MLADLSVCLSVLVSICLYQPVSLPVCNPVSPLCQSVFHMPLCQRHFWVTCASHSHRGIMPDFVPLATHLCSSSFSGFGDRFDISTSPKLFCLFFCWSCDCQTRRRVKPLGILIICNLMFSFVYHVVQLLLFEEVTCNNMLFTLYRS